MLAGFWQVKLLGRTQLGNPSVKGIILKYVLKIG
jgi:hypothetical protein